MHQEKEKGKLNFVKVKGSCTACVVGLDGRRIEAANLGDSGFLVLRRSVSTVAGGSGGSGFSVVAASTPQLHFFNCPWQLSVDGQDKPQDAEVISVDVAPGDLLVLATDGLFDNLHLDEIVQVLDEQLAHDGAANEWTASAAEEDLQATVKMLSEVMARAAQRMARSTTAFTPFAVALTEEGEPSMGGKMDDITVLCSYVCSDDGDL